MKSVPIFHVATRNSKYSISNKQARTVLACPLARTVLAGILDISLGKETDPKNPACSPLGGRIAK